MHTLTASTQHDVKHKLHCSMNDFSLAMSHAVSVRSQQATSVGKYTLYVCVFYIPLKINYIQVFQT
jgi:hypothetical protein